MIINFHSKMEGDNKPKDLNKITYNEIMVQNKDFRDVKVYEDSNFLYKTYPGYKQRQRIIDIMTKYNREKLIIRSIKSILNQTYHNIEVILIDDGSTDNTKKVISQIKDKQLRYIKLRKNQGASVARNIGIQKAIGNYIAFQDSDDFLHSDKLEKQFNNLRMNNSDLDFCKFCLHNKKKKENLPK